MGKCGREPFLQFPRKEQARSGKQAWDWLICRFQQTLGPMGCPSLSGPGSGVIRAGGCGPQCELVEEVGSRLVEKYTPG